MWFIQAQATFAAKYPTMPHYILLKTTVKDQTPNIQVPWLSKAPRLLPGKPISAGTLWTCTFCSALAHLQEWGIASGQLLNRISTTGSAVPSPLAHSSHSSPPEWTMQELIFSLLPALPPHSFCSSSSVPNRASMQITSRSMAECCSSLLLCSPAPSFHYTPYPNTIPSLKFQVMIPHTSASCHLFPGYPAFSVQRDCIRSYVEGSNTEQVACCLQGSASQLCHSTQTQLQKLLVRPSRFCHCCSMDSSK